MLRRVLAPLHPDGLKFVAAAAVATVLLFLLWRPAGWVALVATFWIAYFFRDPWRVTPLRAGLLVSPADGVVMSVEPALPPPELAMPAGDYVRIVPDAQVRQLPLPLVTGKERHPDAEYVSKVIVPRNISAMQLVPILRPLLPQSAHLVALPCTNSLVIVDSYGNIRRIEALTA